MRKLSFGDTRRRGVVAILVVLAISMTAFAGVAGAAITTPTNGQVVRDVGPVTITEDRGGLYAGGTTTQNTLAGATLAGFNPSFCNGSTPNRSPQASGKIEVTRLSDNTKVLTVNHPTANGLTLAASNANGPFSATWDTTTMQPGMYRIDSTNVDVTRSGLPASCKVTATTTQSITVEYRPWQHTFRDILGTGSVSMNTVPKEFSYKVKDKSSDAVIDGTTAMKLFEVGDPASFSLPADPTACTTDPLSCLPPTAKQCANTGPCNARLVVVNYQPNVSPPNKLIGIFDLQTKAFIASASAKGTTRILASLGPALDAQLVALLGSAVTGLQNGTGIDVANLLATKVRVRLAGAQGMETAAFISLGEILTIVQGARTGPNGINVIAPFSLNAGVVFHAALGVSSTAGLPYTVEQSQLVPNLPPAVVLPGGPLLHIEGDYPSATNVPIGSHNVGGLSVDTAPDEPRGLPAWLALVSATSTVPDSDLDFVGNALVIANSSTPLGGGQAFKIGIMFGVGATIFGDNPLPLGFGDLPLIWDPQSPEVLALVAAINSAVGDVMANPTVQDLLGQLLAAVPPLT